MLKLLVGLRSPKVLTKAKTAGVVFRVQFVSATNQELASVTNSQAIDLLLIWGLTLRPTGGHSSSSPVTQTQDGELGLPVSRIPYNKHSITFNSLVQQ